MAQTKRTFNQARIERDLDDRIVPQGTYRDALNISIDTSEDANVGVIENLKGNQLLANQNILGLSSTSNPNAKVIGSYPHPEKDRIYYFVANASGYEASTSDDGNTIYTGVKSDSILECTPNKLNYRFANRSILPVFTDAYEVRLAPDAFSGTSLTGANLFGAGADAPEQIVDITDVIIRDSSNNDYSTTAIARAQYWNYTVKTTSGRPTQFYFERTISPTLYLYPAADQAYTLIYYALVRMSDAGDYTNNSEIPFRFLPCLVAGLAYYISMKKAPERMQALKLLYEDEFKRAADEDGQRTSVYLTPQTYFPTGGGY